MFSVVPPVRLWVLDAVWLIPQRLVHWSMFSVSAAGLTVVSEEPCQIATRGYGPL